MESKIFSLFKTMKVIPLGAGQDVGKSCIYLNIGDKHILFDCGLSVRDNSIPDFSFVGIENIDVILISHFHLDHCGALPYISKNFNGTIFMTAPTRELFPILMEDSLRLSNNSKITNEDVQLILKKITVLNFGRKILFNGLTIEFFYAGHVLGASMIYIEYKNERVMYTGDFNMAPDSHLGPANVFNLNLDLLITESTYGAKIAKNRRNTERHFFESISETIAKGGKILIPTFSIGRAQELTYLVNTFLKNSKEQVKIYFTSLMFKNANEIYKKYTNFLSCEIQQKFNFSFYREKLRQYEFFKDEYEKSKFDIQTVTEENRENFLEKLKLYQQKKLIEERIEYEEYTDNIFNINIHPFKMDYLKRNEPMIIFSAPAMVTSGMSLQIFTKICADSKNHIIIPSYCSKGTYGEKILHGAKKIRVGGQNFNIELKVDAFSFSAHTDSLGISKLIQLTNPKNVMLIHGDTNGMKKLGRKIQSVYKIPVFMPINYEQVNIEKSGEFIYSVDEKIYLQLKNRKKNDEIKIEIEEDNIVKFTDI